MSDRQPILDTLDRMLGDRGRDSLKALADVILIAVAAYWAWAMAFSQVPVPREPWPFVIAVVAVRLPLRYVFRLHRICWRSFSRYDVAWLAASAVVGTPLIVGVFMILPPPFTLAGLTRPALVLVTEASFYLLVMGGARVTVRAAYVGGSGRSSQRTLIVGAGDLGRAVAFQMRESQRDRMVLGFIDDDPALRGRMVRGLPVLGTIEDLPKIAARTRAQQAAIAIRAPSPAVMRRIIDACEQARVVARMVPPMEEGIPRSASGLRLREVRMEDLLPRPEVHLDQEAIGRFLRGKTVLVTGGGGSIGTELCRQVRQAGAAHVLVLGRGENSVFEAVQELTEVEAHGRVTPVICDVRDRHALAGVFADFRPEIVFHAAAHKHVPLMEMYPAEAVHNNVLGTLHMVELAVEFGVERLVHISTDKAVNPSSVMGATKRIGEMIVQAHAVANDMDMVSVRFGNVLGSRGSVVRVMQRQIEKRLSVTVTDPDMVRYFMTIPEAVQLVLQAGVNGGHGDVFVLDMGHPVRILDLARDLIRLSGLVPDQDIPIRIIGRRPGEKVREELLTAGETNRASARGQFHVVPLRPVALNDLLAMVGRLAAAMAHGDRSALVPLLQELVPEFAADDGGDHVHLPAAAIVESPTRRRAAPVSMQSSAPLLGGAIRLMSEAQAEPRIGDRYP
jgi:FlaA1/EpsC-like NDP-sugar epimerase